jgi:P27 family predicted phage terminase small subunit
MRGPQPKATTLKRLEGNPGKRKLNDAEPIPVGVLKKPSFVTDVAAEEWDRIIAAMPPGFYTPADTSTLTVYVCAWAMHRNAVLIIEREGMFSTGATGQTIAHPAIAIITTQAAIILKAGDRLGMSPAARTRLQMPNAAPAKSKFEGLIAIRGGRT